MGTIMSDSVAVMWTRALDQYAAGLEVHAREKIMSIPSLEALLSQIGALRAQYAKKTWARIFDRLNPMMQSLSGFNQCVQTFTQAAPKGFILLWGSLSFIVEIAARYSKSLEQLVEVFEQIERVLPRFEAYASRFDLISHARLEITLIDYHIELIGICLDGIKFFKKNPFRNFLCSSFIPLKYQVAPRVERLRFLIYNIEQEARYSAETVFDTKQQETIRLLKQGFSTCPTDSMLLEQPSYYNLPVRRNPAFFGRVEELRRLSSIFKPQSPPKDLTCCCIYGLSGVGKTQLTLEFAHRQIGNYEAILWVPAETPVKISQAFTAFSRALGLSDDSLQHADQLKDLVMRWLSTRRRRDTQNRFRWLLIFDNVDDPKHIEPYLPQTTEGSIIITSKRADVAYHFASSAMARILVEPFSAEMGSKFLLSLVQRGTTTSKDDEDLARTASIAIGNHPLALDMLGSYMRKCNKSLGRFLQEYPRYDRTLMFDPRLAKWTENAYTRFVSDTWSMSLYAEEMRLDCSANLMIQMLAFLDADNAPVSLLRENDNYKMLLDGPDLPAELPQLDKMLTNPLKEVFAFDRALASLLDYSLIQLDEGGEFVKCHRLVRLVVAESMPPTTKASVFNRVMFQLNAAFPSQSDGRPLHDQWHNCERLAPQVASLLESYSVHQTDLDGPILLCEIVARCSWYFYEKGQFQAALDLVDKALLICQHAIETSDHPGYSPWFVQDMTSHLINVQATVAREKPTTDHGLCLSEKVLAIRQLNYRPGNEEDDFWIATARGNLAVSLMGVRRYNEALDILFDLINRPDMKPHADIYLCNICLCLTQLDRLDEALTYNDKAIRAIEASKGKDSIPMAL
ncbi:hypothetical protein N0V93_009388 [Gnomoniopsis smithogilvyi]|uniref:NB-ARC domain-containing protein n=1 Tax=Gnomoniopsis smithogilvyi TaxID=1191159 RepID=A0A9W8YL04_9PEZI|nr:hypothetical protein N0V93_009388 [Gnomoniopsis smithogilvyi]